MQDAKSGLVASPFRICQDAFPRSLLYNMRLVTLELTCLLGTGTVSKSGSVCVHTCVDSEGFWPAQSCVQFRADCGEDKIISSRAAPRVIQERR
jgi:hypothetical protein